MQSIIYFFGDKFIIPPSCRCWFKNIRVQNAMPKKLMVTKSQLRGSPKGKFSLHPIFWTCTQHTLRISKMSFNLEMKLKIIYSKKNYCVLEIKIWKKNQNPKIRNTKNSFQKKKIWKYIIEKGDHNVFCVYPFYLRTFFFHIEIWCRAGSNCLSMGLSCLHRASSTDQLRLKVD